MFTMSVRRLRGSRLPKLSAFYLLDRKILLGEGAFSKVFLGSEKSTLKGVAIKEINTKLLKPGMVKNIRAEIEIMQKLDHPEVIKILHTFEEGGFIFIVMPWAKKVLGTDKELCEKRMQILKLIEHFNAHQKFPAASECSTDGKNTLLDKLDNTRLYSEPVVQYIVRQLVKTLEYLKTQNVIHRDLKPANILLNDGYHVLLTDFNLSKDLQSNMEFELMKGQTGTVAYMAPEVLKGEPYDFLCDVWSLGVIIYQLLSNGFFPYPIKKGYKDYLAIKPKVFVDYIKEQFVDFRLEFKPYLIWERVSPEAKDLLSQLLVLLPGNRADYSEICSHSWIQEAKKFSNSQVTEKIKGRPRGSGSFGSSFATMDILNKNRDIDDNNFAKLEKMRAPNKFSALRHTQSLIDSDLSENEMSPETEQEPKKLSKKDLNTKDLELKYDHSVFKTKLKALGMKKAFGDKLNKIVAPETNTEQVAEKTETGEQKEAIFDSGFTMSTLSTEVNVKPPPEEFKTGKILSFENLPKVKQTQKQESGYSGAFKVVNENEL